MIQVGKVVPGHSSGALLASYVAAYGGSNVVGLLLEDPPVFSIEPDFFEKSFAYQDTYKNMHDYLNSDQQECWEAYYVRTRLCVRMYMPDVILMAAAANEQADKAVSLIGDCELIRLSGNHDIHRFDSQAFIDAINLLQERD